MAAQEKFLRDYAQRRDIDVEQVFAISETASKPQQRRLFQEMMSFLRRHRVKVLVVEKVDRLTRNFKDTVLIDDWLEEDEERQVHFVKDSLVLHKKSSSQEKLNWGVRVVLAKNFIDNLREETSKGVVEKLESDGYPGKPPVGYTNVTINGRNEIQIDESKAPLARRMFELSLEPRMTVTKLTETIQNLGLTTSHGRPLSRSQLAETLRNPFYIGKMRWNGRIYKGGHEPLIDAALFHAVQQRLDRKGSPKRRFHDPLFQGLIRCASCEALVSWELQKGRYYGRCRGTGPCTNVEMIREDRCESQIVKALDVLIAPWPGAVDFAVDKAKAEAVDEIGVIVAKKREMRNRRDDLARREDLLYEDRLAGRISAERYDLLVVRLHDEQEKIESELRAGESEWQEVFKHNMRLLVLSQRAGQLFQAGMKEERRLLLHEFFKTMHLKKRQVLYEWTPTAQEILKTAEQDRSKNGRYEPRDNYLGEGKTAPPEGSNTIWYRLTSILRTLQDGYNPACAEHAQQLEVLADAENHI